MNQEKVVVITDSITVGELAEALRLPVTTLVGELFKNGIVATINQRLDFETAQIIVDELKVEARLERNTTQRTSLRLGRAAGTEGSVRPPIVAVMGHVDHGKTSLLDAILGMRAAAGEAGGITQYISAYQVEHSGRTITLLDTPGHEAFAALRQHGASLTDVVIIVVAADDGVQPQTVEAIRFARTANAKIVVAINKMDKPAANAQHVRTQLATEHGLNPEEWGGDVVMVEVSAKTRQNIDKLLEMVLLVADIEDLRADEDMAAEGLVIESHMETGRGAVVSLLVQQGFLKPGHYLVAGATYAKVRTLQDFKGRTVKMAGPAMPAIVTGFKEIPTFGDEFVVVKTERDARARTLQARLAQADAVARSNVTSGDLLSMMTQADTTKEFNVILKADVQGSLTSVQDSLRLIDTSGEVRVRVVGSGVGNVTENDIRLAEGAHAVIYGFNIELPAAVKRLSLREKVPVRLFTIIYELLGDAKTEIEARLAPKIVETELGTLTVKGVFRTSKDELIAGGQVTGGKIVPGSLVRLKHGNEIIGEAAVKTVQKNKQEAKEVIEGDICGLQIATTKKILTEIGDTMEFFSRDIVKRKLS